MTAQTLGGSAQPAGAVRHAAVQRHARGSTAWSAPERRDADIESAIEPCVAETSSNRSSSNRSRSDGFASALRPALRAAPPAPSSAGRYESPSRHRTVWLRQPSLHLPTRPGGPGQQNCTSTSITPKLPYRGHERCSKQPSDYNEDPGDRQSQPAPGASAIRPPITLLVEVDDRQQHVDAVHRR
jgi:hypothetical protein